MYKLQQLMRKNMIKNIKLIATSAACEYILNDYTEKNQEVFIQNKMYCLPLSYFLRDDFLSENRFERVDLSAIWALLPDFNWKDALKPIENIQHDFNKRKEETLIIICDNSLLQIKHIDFFHYLDNIFSKKQASIEKDALALHIKDNISIDTCLIHLDLSLEMTNIWIAQQIDGVPSSLLQLISHNITADRMSLSTVPSLPHFKYFIKEISNATQENAMFFRDIEQIFCINEAEIIPNFLQFLAIELPNTALAVQYPKSFIFAPEVISYMHAIHAYFSQRRSINWLSQIELLNYKTNPVAPYNYLNSYCTQKLIEKFWISYENTNYPLFAQYLNLLAQKEEALNLQKQDNISASIKSKTTELLLQLENEITAQYDTIIQKTQEEGAQKAQEFLQSKEFIARPCVFEALNIVTKENAFILGELLEKDFRQFLLNKVNRKNLQYQSQSIRNVFAALLKIENEIDEHTYTMLTKSPLGTVLTGDDSCKNNPLQEPKVTVLTQTYNQEQFIEKQIMSVIMQKTDFPVSHIIIDDCSTDGTREILLRYAALYPHITLILREKNRIGHAIYSMFDQVTSPYVSLCEGDDYFIHRRKLQKQVSLLEENKDYALTFHITQFEYLNMEDPDGTKGDGTGWRTKYHPNAWPEGKKFIRLAELLKGNLIQTNSVMYRWRFTAGMPLWFIKQILPGDWYWHILHAEQGKIGFDPVLMSVYVRHPGGFFSDTVYSIVKHRQKRGKGEIHFFEHINVHFKGRYERTMRNGQASVFVTLGQDAMQTKNYSFYIDLCKAFPYLCKEFDLNIERIEKTAELEALNENTNQ